MVDPKISISNLLPIFTAISGTQFILPLNYFIFGNSQLLKIFKVNNLCVKQNCVIQYIIFLLEFDSSSLKVNEQNYCRQIGLIKLIYSTIGSCFDKKNRIGNGQPIPW